MHTGVSGQTDVASEKEIGFSRLSPLPVAMSSSLYRQMVHWNPCPISTGEIGIWFVKREICLGSIVQHSFENGKSG
ncbi:hypothetical protein EMIT0P2_70078 [Pseudomonas sp. IT-P2]